MENNFSREVVPPAKKVANTVRETLLKVCRHYQEPGLGVDYATVARYYEKQVASIPPPPRPRGQNMKQAAEGDF